jgi:hypothetical protein
MAKKLKINRYLTVLMKHESSQQWEGVQIALPENGTDWDAKLSEVMGREDDNRYLLRRLISAGAIYANNPMGPVNIRAHSFFKWKNKVERIGFFAAFPDRENPQLVDQDRDSWCNHGENSRLCVRASHLRGESLTKQRIFDDLATLNAAPVNIQLYARGVIVHGVMAKKRGR